MNGVPAQEVWPKILAVQPKTLTETLRYRVAEKAHKESLNYRDIARQTGLGRASISNFVKAEHRATTDILDILHQWVSDPEALRKAT